MTKKIYPPSIPHEVVLKRHLKEDPEFAVEYLKVAMEEATDDVGRDVLLHAIRRIAEVHGIAKIARKAGLKRESLSRALSPRGNPRLDTLLSTIHAMGMKLTIEPIRAH